MCRTRRVKISRSVFIISLRASRTMIMAVMCVTLVLIFNLYKTDLKFVGKDVHSHYIMELHKHMVDQFYEGRKSWNLSNLGNLLYKNEEYPISKEKNKKKFVILIWKHWKLLQKRHVYYFGSVRHDPLKGCSVSNCEFTGDDDKLQSADAVIVHLQKGLIPSLENRTYSQRWIFLNDEAPLNVFSRTKIKIKLSDLNNTFNWSMTYSSKADVPVPYGRTVALMEPKLTSSYPLISDLVPNWSRKRRDVPAAILISNCHVTYRIKLLVELKKYLPLHVHGKCGHKELQKSCPGHFKADCEVMSQYLFYVVLENSKCSEYMTEKLFHNAYYRGAIPIIQGPSVKECNELLPPNSFLHVDSYASLKDLADDILRISLSDEKLLYYHKWRSDFEVANEHGFFGSKSFHLCRVCEAMNYNSDAESVYSEQDIRLFLDPSILCRE